MPTASVDLPFAVPAKEREKAFTPSMETAAMLLLVEAKRRRRGLFGTAPAKISFLSKLHYPLWAVPWESQYLIIDGLGVFSSAIVRRQLPDVIVFIEDIERDASVRELFRKAIEKHLKTFSDFAGKVSVQVDASITDKALLSDLSDYVQEALSERTGENLSIVLAPPKIDVKKANEIAKQVRSLHRQVQSEIASLDYARNLLKETMKLHEQMILKEASFTREAYEAQIAELRPTVEKRMNQLLEERDTRMAKMNRIAQTELKAKEGEKERRERELQRLELSKADLVRKREARRQRHDKIAEAHWEHRIKANQNRIEEVKARIHALTEFIEKTRKQGEADAEKMRQGYQWLIDQERRKITDLEFQRDEAVEAGQKEIETLKLSTDGIAGQIEELAAGKRKEAEELKRLAIPSQFDDVTLLCLPSYIVCYQTENATQFHVFPPVRVMSPEGVIGAIRKKLGGFRTLYKVTLFLQPRSRALSKMLDFAIKEKAKSDKTFSASLSEAAVSSNILLEDNLKETLTRGVAELKAEGWITQKEEALIKTYI